MAVSTHAFSFQNTDLRAALDSIGRWYSASLVFLDRDVAGKQVSTTCSGCRLREALQSVLDGQSLTWKVIGDQIVIHMVEPSPLASAGTIAGTVIDSVSGGGLMGALVVLLPSDAPHDALPYRGCTTNQFGFFSLQGIAQGTYSLRISSVGYCATYRQVAVDGNDDMIGEIALGPQDVQLQEITVEAQRSSLASTEGIARGVFIPATPQDQNQYFLEGTRIYNPAHYAGVMSTFSGDALRDVNVLAGGVPPYYGGRFGGILDVALRNGVSSGMSGAASAGSLGSTLLLEGPLSDAATLMVSGRAGYPDIISPGSLEFTTPADLRSFEVMSKATFMSTDNSRFFLTLFLGRDLFDNSVTQAPAATLSNRLRWGNTAASLRWISVLSPSLFVYASAGYTGYAFSVDQNVAGTGFAAAGRYRSDFDIGDVTTRANAEYFYDEHHTVRGGFELTRHHLTGTISDFATQLGAYGLNGVSPWELSVYFQDQWQLTSTVSAEIGARATSFIGTAGSSSSVDPRFSLLAAPGNDLHLYGSVSSVTQFLHPYRNSGVFSFTPALFLYPSTDQILPSTSLQISIGGERGVQSYSVAVEAFYRVTQHLHEFAFDTVRSAGQDIINSLLFGQGTVYGAGVTITRRSGNVTGSIRYGLSWARNRFDGVNGGDPYTPRFNRRHEVLASLSYVPAEDWTLGVLCLLSSHNDRTSASVPQGARFAAGDISPTLETPEFTRFGDHIDLNGSRVPGFQRLEFRLQHRFPILGLPCQATFSLLNGFGLVDPFVWQLHPNADPRLQWSVGFDGPGLFPLYPVFNMNVRF